MGAEGRVCLGIAVDSACFSDREEKIKAVVAAPAAAEMPAMIARVLFDMMADQ